MLVPAEDVEVVSAVLREDEVSAEVEDRATAPSSSRDETADVLVRKPR